jgi:Ca2+-binding RTX toxin-like protein
MTGNESPTPGDYSYQTLIHEIGHALGFKHPGPYGGGIAPFLPGDVDNTQYTVMSYNTTHADMLSTGIYPGTPMLYDVAAIQFLYGANGTTRNGNDTYTFAIGELRFETIWDSGGIDTIDASALTEASVIDLRQGQFSSLRTLIAGSEFMGALGNENIAIAYNTVIENAIGGGGRDTLIGNDANNQFEGGAGNDTLEGGLGEDTASYSGLRSAYTLSRAVGTVSITGPDGSDTLSNIEILQFSDITLRLNSTASDFNGDGQSDILWRNAVTGGNSIWRSGASASEQSVTAVPDPNWKIVGVGDFDGDGKADILWRNSGTGANSIWKSGNSASVQAVAQISDQNWKVAGTGDFDGDGKSDILWRNSATGNNAIWKNGSNTNLQSIAALADQDWKVAGIGDFDGDGQSDILWRNSNTGNNSLWKNGSHTTVQSLTAQPDPNWKIVGIGDFDGNGRSDIVWRNSATGANSLWRNGDSSNLQSLTAQPDLNWKIVGTGDYDGDGRSDLHWRNSATGGESIWKGGNSTSLQAVVQLADQNWQIIDGLESGDLLQGGAGNNTLHGTLSNDILTGGLGNDTLTGGAGADQFNFNTAPNASSNLDTLTDFTPGSDKLALDDLIYTSLGANVEATELRSGAGLSTAADANDFLIYNSTTGALYYDADGVGGTAAVQFAVLTGAPTISSSDFLMA